MREGPAERTVQAVAPPQLEPEPAVQPKQCGPIAMRRWSRASRVASTIGGDAVYKATVALDGQPNGLLWGMSATVRIQAGD